MRRREVGGEPEFPGRLREFDPGVWCCEISFEAERTHWLFGEGGVTPIGRKVRGVPVRLAFCQEMSGRGPLVCDCKSKGETGG
jgi:hypothetical protein